MQKLENGIESAKGNLEMMGTGYVDGWFWCLDRLRVFSDVQRV
jgi:hypothetical protein